MLKWTFVSASFVENLSGLRSIKKLAHRVSQKEISSIKNYSAINEKRQNKSDQPCKEKY